MDDPAAERAFPACPECGGVLQSIDPSSPRLVRCSACGRETFLAEDADDDEEVPLENPTHREDELDGMRIRQLSTARQAAYRARSYAVIAAVVAAVAAGDLIYYAWMRMHVGDWGLWTITYLAIAIVCIGLAILFLKRAADLHREAQTSPLTNPASAPDFSQLSDGTDQWKKLEEVD